MNEEYFIANGNVVVSTNKEVKKVIPYTDNFLEVLCLENIHSFLQARLDEDEKRLKKYSTDRDWRLRDYKKTSAICAGIAVGATVLAAPLFGISSEPVSTVFGEIPKWANYFMIMTPSMLVVSQAISLIGLTFRPSKESIEALKSVIEYERTEFEYVCDTLVDVKSDTSVTNDPYTLILPRKIEYKDEIKRIQDGINLRYSAVVLRKKYEKLYREGTLAARLLSEGLHPTAVADFIEYLDINSIFEDEADNLTKSI